MDKQFSFERKCLDCGMVGGSAKFFKKTSYCHGCSRRRRSEKHGWSPMKYDRVYKEQLGSCAICSVRTLDLVIDHDHCSGYRRGLLCSNCNSGLGLFKDNPEILQRAIEYLNISKTKHFSDVLTDMDRE